MSESKKHIDRVFQEAFQDFEAQPPHSTWHQIEKKLTTKKKRFFPFLVLLKYAAVVTSGLIIFGLGAFYQNFKTSSSAFTENKYGTQSKIIYKNDQYFWKNHFIDNSETDYSSALWQDLSLIFDDFSNQTSSEIANFASTKEKNTNTDFLNYKSASIIQNSFDFETSMLLFDHYHLHKKQKSENSPEIKNPWMVNPQIAPIYASSLNGSNTLNQKYEAHTSDINMSYGVKLAYQVTPKLSVRTGINQVNMNYKTEDIVQTYNMSSYNKTNLQNTVASQQKYVTSYDAKRANYEEYSSGNVTSGYLSQDMGFIEIPLEVEYKLIDKEIGFHIMAGTSTLLLNQNQVSYHSEALNSYAGKTANINKTSFSANIGFGVDYNFSDKWSLNLEPNFKYQINTFEVETTNVQPYYFGLFSGVKFRF
ncbi:MAG: outer membrane beta-barrel protein [Psychroflexus halocasei]